jgi:flagellar FliL protein
MAEDDLDLDVEQKKSGGKKILIFALIGVFVLGLGATTTVLLLSGGDEVVDQADEGGDDAKSANKKAKKKKRKKKSHKKKHNGTPHYTDLDPIVVNLNDPDSGVRFLQVAFTLQTGSAADADKVKLHMPVIRHHLNLLLSSQKFNELKTRAGKIKLQRTSLRTLKRALDDVAGEKIVQQVFIRSIVGQ